MKKISLFLASSLILFGSSEVEDLKKTLKLQQEVIDKLQNRLDNLENRQIKDTKKMKREIKTISSLKSSLNPEISLITDFSFVSRNLKDNKYKSLEIPAFIHSESDHSHEGHSHNSLNEKRGFNFNYAELGISSEVDPYFDLNSIFHLSESSFEVEEAFISSRNLPIGLKVGKFFSDFGRLNKKHHHYWSFADNSLVHKSFFGEHNLLEKGVALNYVFPLDFYLNFGFEALRGENENSFGTDSFGDLSEIKQPNLYVSYLKASHSFDDLTILAGLSFAKGKARFNHGLEESHEEHEEEEGVHEESDAHGFDGDSKIYGVDFTLRYDIDSYRYLMLESEYLYRELDGDRYDAEFNKKKMLKKQSGLYAQLVYKFDREFAVGARYENLNKNDVFINSKHISKPDNLTKYSFMAEYMPSEFSKIRLQYNRDNSKYIENQKESLDEVILQMNFTIGVHQAHQF